MLKRTVLEPYQEVVIIYHKNYGYIQEKAVFLEYNNTEINGKYFDIPVFRLNENKISGLDCFWLTLDKAQNKEEIKAIQKELISLQSAVLENSKLEGIQMPQKIMDNEINEIAEENVSRINNIVEKLGFDPRDESWIEEDLAENKREKNWFKFERENPNILLKKWEEIIEVFNKHFNDKLSTHDAISLSKKRMRYILGSHYIRMSGNSNTKLWIENAKQFEKKHRDRENRMLTWSLNRKGLFPLVKTKVEIDFLPGPYLNKCMEKIPHLFSSPECKKIKPNTVLKLVSYDPQEKYVTLDFVDEIRSKLKPPSNTPWDKSEYDYIIWIKPDDLENKIEFLEPID